MEPEAILAYGISVGGANGWLIKEADKYGCLPDQLGDWYVYDEDGDFIEAAKAKLGDASGVMFIEWGSAEDPDYLMVTYAIVQDWEEKQKLDLRALDRLARSMNWDVYLALACKKLGITPTDEDPAWIFCSHGNE